MLMATGTDDRDYIETPANKIVALATAVHELCGAQSDYPHPMIKGEISALTAVIKRLRHENFGVGA